MTECKPQPVFFSSLKHKKVVADFQGGTLSSDAGGLLLREADRRLGLIEALNGCLVDPRDPAKVIHEQKTLLAQRIFGMALGYEDLNDHDELRKDPLFSLLANQFPDPNQALASSPTLCRLENRVDRQALVGMSRVLVEQFIASFEKAPQELILDFDATDDLVHGNQENRFFHGYYDGYCFLPLYVFCENRLLVAYLRPSNIDGALHAKAILKLLVTRLRQAWPGVRIVMRADSGFCRWKLMRWCDRNGVFYVLGLPRNEILQRLAKPWQDQAKLEFESSQEKQRDFHELFYGAQSWDRKRRVIVKTEYQALGANLRFVVTNLADRTAKQLYDELYVQRGDMENRIKEQQLGLFADRTSCHVFLANQFRLLLSAAAYVLIEHLRRVALKGTELAKAQVSTIRLKLFKIAARIQISVRRIVFHLSSAYPLQKLFFQIASRYLAPGQIHLSSP